MMDKVLIDAVAKGLPDFFPVSDVSRLTMGMVGQSNLSNLIYNGVGPVTHAVGRKRYLVKEEFIEWMEIYFNGMEVVRNGSGSSGNGATVRLSESAKEKIGEIRRRAEVQGDGAEGLDPAGDDGTGPVQRED